MDHSERSKKSRSIASESSAHPRSAVNDRPNLGIRTHSSPTLKRPGQTQPKPGDLTKASAIHDRYSTASIRDDPFFRPYQTPQSIRMAETTNMRRDHQVAKTDELAKYGDLSQVNLVVLGAQGVGKSTFVQKALDLRQQPVSHYSSKKMSLDGVIYLVRLLEISMEEILISDRREVQWPQNVSDRSMPSVDGVLVLYDVTNPESIQGVAEILSALSKSATPFMLVSCKCDHPPQLRQIAPGLFRQASGLLNGIDAHQVSANVPESQKRCISIILRQILARSSEYSRRQSTASSKSRATTSNKVDPRKPPRSPRTRQHQQISPDNETKPSKDVSNPRAKSPLKLNLSQESNCPKNQAPDLIPKDPEQSNPSFNKLLSHQEQTSRSDYQLTQPLTPLSPDSNIVSDLPSPASFEVAETKDAEAEQTIDRIETIDSIDTQVYDSFLNMGDDFDEHSVREAKADPLLEIAKLKVSPPPAPAKGDSMEDLVERLLAVPMTKQESKFIPIFLCLYRKFATPARLLSLIVKKFDDAENGTDPQLLRVGEQLRFLQVLSQWAGDYPNDFAHLSVRNQLLAFLNRLEKSRIFAYAAKEVNCNIDKSNDEDEDEGWVPLEDDEIVTPKDYALHNEKSETNVTITSTSTLTDSKEDLHSKKSWSSSQEEISSTRQSLNLSQTSSGVVRSQQESGSNQSISAVRSGQEAQKEASKLIPIPRRPLSKLIWRRFIEISDDDFARELTRIDWVMYSSISPRDLVRHVGLASIRQTGKEKALKSSNALRNVDRMIDHFNHLTLFVSAMILFRDKAKHRAQALEKFMSISWKLRQMNNYNSLGALLAGINNSTVSRLSETWALIPPQTSKQFMRLNILMGSAKSHFAYRLAWENSFTERIPFIPLHRRDLVAAEDGNRTFVGPKEDKINWKKFEIMGEVVIGIQKSQDKPYIFGSKNQEVAWMVLETRILDGDEDIIDPYQELHERSMALEPGRGNSDAGRRNWFKR